VALLPIFAAVPALAQSAPQTETIEVTGSRLKNTDVQSANPITVVTAEDIAKTEATSVEQVLRKLPSADFTGGVTANSNNGGDGASQISLHNLGPARTLVLVNGQRFVGTDIEGTITPVDLNNIPISMIDHIEILRDGASSIYGADAIAGVINIITKQHFNGVQVDTSLGITDKADGLTYSTAVTAGADFDRGNILLNMSQDHRDAIDQNARGWASNQFIGTDAEGDGPISSKLPVLTGKVFTDAAGDSTGTRYFNNANGSSVSVASPTLLGTPGLVYLPAIGREYFDLSQQPHLIGELDRKQLNVTAHYDLVPNVTAVLEGFYTDRRSEQRLNPDPLSSTISTTKYPGLLIPACIGEPVGGIPAGSPFLNADGSVNCAAAGLTPNTQNPLDKDVHAANYRPFGGGDRVYKDELQTYRLRAGLEGTLLSKYDWQVGYVYGQSSATYQVYGEDNFSHLAELTGQVACSAGDIAQGCSVGNFFGINSLTPAQIKYLEYTDTRTSQVEEDYVYANIGGPVYQLPAGPVQLSVGFEQRNESGYDHPDSTIVNGDGDANAAPSSGAYSVTSTYAELNIPLVKDIPFVKSLTADVSSRYDLYTTFGRALTWKAGINYQVNDDIRFRGSDSTGFRAPQVKELYGGTYQNFLTFSGDPCDTNGGQFVGSASCNAALRKVGINPATYVSQLDLVANPQVPTLSGGNAHLKPETSQQFSLGTVLTPHWVPNLAITADYYNIHVRNAIGAFDPGTIINQCYGPQQLSTACAAITRSAASGDISAVVSNDVNFGYENTDGIEVGVTYAMDTAMIGLPSVGALKWDGQASYLIHDTTLNSDGTIRENAGTYDIATGAGEPRYKALLGLTFLRDNWSVGWTTRYYGGVKNVDETTYNTTNANGTPCTKGCGDYLGNEAAGVFYHDISGTYQYKNVTLTVGVDNLFDKDPPVIFGDVSSANSLSAAGYDFTGRFLYMKASVKF
jgi:outer membrane receptor protein involved in Fe transport